MPPIALVLDTNPCAATSRALCEALGSLRHSSVPTPGAPPSRSLTAKPGSPPALLVGWDRVGCSCTPTVAN